MLPTLSYLYHALYVGLFFLLDEILMILPGKPHSLDNSDVIKEINKKRMEMT